jgi:hypothetical protein
MQKPFGRKERADMKPRVYIAGPMRGKPGFNFAEFDKAEKFLHDQGFTPISPAAMDRLYEGWGDAPPEDLPVDDTLKRRCMSRDLAAVLDLRPERGDFLFVLRGWEESKGAQAEIAVAKFMGLSIVFEWDLTFSRRM